MSEENKNQIETPLDLQQEKALVGETIETTSPVVVLRDKYGLLDGVHYIFKDEGRRVDWRAMIPNQYLVPNRANFEKRSEPVPESIENVADKDLLILLDGIKYLADLRGFTSVSYTISSSSIQHCTVVCAITWLPNYETEFQMRVFSGIGDATIENCTGFGKLFLGPIAENRAFIRAVRNFLRIPIIGKEELNNETLIQEPNNTNGKDKILKELDNLMKSKGVSFQLVKDKLTKENILGAERFNSINDLPKDVIFNLIERLQKKKTSR